MKQRQFSSEWPGIEGDEIVEDLVKLKTILTAPHQYSLAHLQISVSVYHTGRKERGREESTILFAIVALTK